MESSSVMQPPPCSIIPKIKKEAQTYKASYKLSKVHVIWILNALVCDNLPKQHLHNLSLNFSPFYYTTNYALQTT
jgi:hypothetical protein